MQDNLRNLLTQFKRLGRAHDRLAKAVPDPASAATDADQELVKTLSLLRDPAVRQALDELIPSGRESLSGTSQEPPSKEEFDAEIALLRRLGLKQEDTDRLSSAFQRSKSITTQTIKNAEDLEQTIVKVHESVKIEIELSRTLPRKEKKKRKRQIAQGITSALFGSGVIVADVYAPPLFAFSYAAGAGAIHQALRDLIGAAPE